MPRGGKRPGAGRKKGSVTKRTSKTTALAQQAAGEGPTPLEVLLRAMRHFDAGDDHKRAAAVAKDAAPYLHPKLSSVTHSGGIAVRKEIVEELVDAPDCPPDGPAAPGTA